MTVDGKEYALFSYKPQSRFPPMTPWKPKESVCIARSDGKYTIDHEFFEWISATLFPYEIYTDHTPNLKLSPKTVTRAGAYIIPQKLQFREMEFF